MVENQIHKLTDQPYGFYISVKKISIFKNILLIGFFLIFFLLPFFIIALNISNHEDLKFQFLLGLLFHWGIAYYLFRLIAWNNYGTEKFLLSDAKLKRYLDYMYFKDSFQEIDIEGVHFTMEDIGYEEDGMAVLIIENEDKVIKSNIKVRKTELQSFIEKRN